MEILTKRRNPHTSSGSLPLGMKKIQSLIFLFLFLLIRNFCFAQQSDEVVLRNLENEEREAIMKSDTVMLRKLFSTQIVVHNPENTIVGYDRIIERIKAGKINYASFERIIENISFVENIGIVMGKEIIVPQGVTANAGKTITRRFTNIWMKHGDAWKLTARQATIILFE